MKRELKRRSAIEPMIGHAKTDGRLGRNHLLGQDGDKINALLAAAGHNLRLILRKLAFLFAKIIAAFLAGHAKVNTWPTTHSRQISVDYTNLPRC
jgi:IS5 family transposase